MSIASRAGSYVCRPRDADVGTSASDRDDVPGIAASRPVDSAASASSGRLAASRTASRTPDQAAGVATVSDHRRSGTTPAARVVARRRSFPRRDADRGCLVDRRESRSLETKGDILVVRRFVTLTCRSAWSWAWDRADQPILRPGRGQEGRPAGQAGTAPKEDGQAQGPEAGDPKEAAEGRRAGQEGEAPKATEAPLPPIPPGGPGQARGRPQGRGRGDRRRPGCRPGRDLDRSAADPRHPDHRLRDRRPHPQEHRRPRSRTPSAPRSSARLVHRLRQARGFDDQLRQTTSGSSTPAPGSRRGTTSARPS